VSLDVSTFRMDKPYRAKTKELQRQLSDLGVRLRTRDDSRLLVWVIPEQLACAHRPLRKHPDYDGSQVDLPPDAAPLVLQWVRRIKDEGIQSVVAIMGDRELDHYDLTAIGVSGLLELYEREGLRVRRIDWQDPAHTAVSVGLSYDEQLQQARTAALEAFDTLPKPVLIHCSSGIQRSSPVAAFIFAHRSDQ
jgi:hypothetical protein